MTRLLLPLALALAAIAGSARADTFVVVPSTPLPAPSAEAPNAPQSVLLPAGFSTPPAQPEQLPVEALQSLWQRAGAAYGIPWQVLAAINKIESNFGRNMGPSSAGAIGWMQFMPSTWLRWGFDANGDGVADPWNAEDAVYSASRYLAAAGGGTDLARAVFAYNHAQWYVDEVLQLAGFYGASGVDEAFSVDQLQQSLDEAKRALLRANRRLVAAERAARALSRLEDTLLARADRAPLLSDRLALGKRAAQVDLRRQAAAAAVERLRIELAQAEAALQAARDRAQAAAFAPGAATLLAAPAFDGNYVFPVGGGPAAVSVSSAHHDYPAADIAAPEGAPVYALESAVVERAWRIPDARCGIGLTLLTGDGLTWTYCHLAYLEPSVEAGAALAAGAPVGLVGETGDATGPHLHLQLQPPTAYPQDQPWFQAFADSAFRWQDEGPARALAAVPPGPATGAVFAVVPTAPEPFAGTGPVIAFSR